MSKTYMCLKLGYVLQSVLVDNGGWLGNRNDMVVFVCPPADVVWKPSVNTCVNRLGSCSVSTCRMGVSHLEKNCKGSGRCPHLWAKGSYVNNVLTIYCGEGLDHPQLCVEKGFRRIIFYSSLFCEEVLGSLSNLFCFCFPFYLCTRVIYGKNVCLNKPRKSFLKKHQPKS